MPYTQVSNLDYDQIKTALKEYISSTSDFTDYDFEGSTLSVLLDVLAYNTYYTAFNTNMVVNELFLESATLRDNVVALAKQLGYTPKSVIAPTAKVSFTVNFSGSIPLDNQIILKKGTGFIANYDNTLYQYSVVDDIKQSIVSGSAAFDNIEIKEGTLITNTYTVNTSLKNQRYIIENQSVDTSTIRVRVYASAQTTLFEEYKFANNILDVDPESKIYFLSEIEDERYEIFFGDGVLGKKLENNQKIEISYLITNGPETNGVREFTFNGVFSDISGNTNYPFTVSINSSQTQASSGGAEIEGIDKIKYNAPKYFGTQNRAVTAQDYAAIARNIYPTIADIITFGGEEQDPPAYGQVFLAIKPSNSAYLSSVTKQQIKNDLKKYMVASVTPEILDPSILYIELDSKIYYDTSRTEESQEQIRSKVISGINSYIQKSDTEKFNGKFRYSKFVGVIDDADRSINSNLTEVIMRKDFYPQINSSFYYEVCYQNAFEIDCDNSVMSSTGFVVSEYPTRTVYLEDRSGKIVLYRLDPLTGSKIVLNDSQGDINYEKGEIMLYDLTIIKGSFADNKIELRVKPRSNDIVAKREVYLDVDVPKSKFQVYQE
jgi:hypothetical protein